jgi:histidinol-phosphate/aromatic aminotransferase/cobyric acid decarboxylase-like protein
MYLFDTFYFFCLHRILPRKRYSEEFGEKELKAKVNDFTQGTNALGPSNKARNAIRRLVRHVAEFSPEQLNHLKGYIAGREGVDEACVSFGGGSTAILSTILELTGPKKILIPYPFSQRYSAVLKKHSLESRIVSLNADEDFVLNIKEFCGAMNGCDAAMLPNPHDVAGSLISAEDIVRVVDEADRLDIALVIDEAYADYTGSTPPLIRVTNSKRAVILRTFSTFHALGGLRLGYIIGPPGFVSSLEARLDPTWINSFAPSAAIASMKDKGYRRRTLLFIEGEKAYLHEMLSRINGVKCYVSPSNILVIRLQKELGNLQKSFTKYHVLIDTFTDDEDNTCIRFPIQTHRLNTYFVRIIKKIAEAENI